MLSEPRRIAELVERYRLEPSLRDVYVEGNTDRRFLKWYFEGKGYVDAVVYGIQTVEVPSDVVERHGFEVGNRGRVLALGAELVGALGEHAKQATCIADRDFDSVLGSYDYGPLTLLTDGSCLETYFFDQECVGKLFGVCLRAECQVTAELIGQFSCVLRRLYCIRAANKNLGLGISWIDFLKWCRTDGTLIEFESEKFTNSYLGRAHHPVSNEAFQLRVLELEEGGRGDYRLYVNRDDFVRLLAWFVNETGLRYQGGRRRRAQRYEEDQLARMLVGCVESRILANHPLFLNLDSRLRG